MRICNFPYLLALFTVLAFSQYSSAQKNVNGEWGDPISFGIVPVAVANLPDGRLLCWSSQFRNTFIEAGDGATFSQYFDPFGGPDGKGGVDGPEFTINTDHDMFCPGINNLPDGRILSAGGTSSERTSIFDPKTGLWSVAAEMNIPRGYQGNVTMQDGNVFTVGGSWSDYNSNNPSNPLRNGGKDAEIWSPTTGWITLPNIQGEDIYTANDLATEGQGLYRIDNHVWLWPAPNGYLFHAGPSEMMHWINPNAAGGEIVNAGIRQDLGAGQVDGFSMKGNTVMFDTGKILKTGGAPEYGANSGGTTPARQNSFVIDINGVSYGGTPSVTFGGFMNNARTMHSSTVLPNGEVLVTGGLGKAALFTDDMAVYGAEIFNENTGWRTVAAMQEARTYHSVAILMVDGRVFVGGGGLCDATPGCVNHFSAEIYTPPYLFNGSGNLATRPNIISFDSGNTTGSYGEIVVDYNSTLDVTTDVDVTGFSLIRFSAATHATNNEQRRIPLTTTTGTSHSLSIPDRNLLPPGYYMLFAMDTNGVPSMAKTLKIGNALPLSSNPNVVMELKFDENSGTNVADSSGNGNNGTILEREDDGTPRTANDHDFVTGLFGNALELDGKEFQSNSIVDISSSPSIRNIKDKVTISAWVWRDAESIASNGKVANVAVFAHNYPYNFLGFHNTLFKWSFAVDNGLSYPNNFVDLYSGYAPLEGWNHIVGTYDGTEAKLYANGVEVAHKYISGNLRWLNDGTDYSSVTTAGFYDHRYDINNPPPVNPTDPDGNLSGITDELDGKIDELVVYNVALGAEEVANLFNKGVAQGNPNVPMCEGNFLEIEYKINSGAWETNPYNRITAMEGDEVYLRAKDFSGQYFLTTQILDGPTYDSEDDFNGEGAFQIDFQNDGNIDVDDAFMYVLITPEGCHSTIQVDVIGSCDPGDTEIFPEYQINGAWSSGASEITLEEGDQLAFSVVPNDDTAPEVYPITIVLPNGTTAGDNYTINPVEKSAEGRYQFISAQGCSKILDVFVNEVDCGALGLETEYQINGGSYISGQASVDVLVGDDLVLSILPNGVPYSIVSNSSNGNSKSNGTTDLTLNNVTFGDAGTYTFTTASGCSVQLEVNVDTFDCEALGLATEYQINNIGPYVEGASQLMIDEGNTVTLSIVPNGVPYTITSNSINNNGKPLNTSDLTLTDLTKDDEGIYVFETSSGCAVQLELIVNEIDCGELGLKTQYDINGANNFIEGADEVRLNVGDAIQLSVVPDVYNGQMLAFSIDGPNGNDKLLNDQDLTVTNIQEADEGVYTMTSSSGCQVQLVILVGANEDPTAVASADVTDGFAPLTVQFDGSGSSDDGIIATYAWNFGDGTSSNEISPEHTFTDIGDYVVTLTVTDTEGATDNTTVDISVVEGNTPPTAVASADPVLGMAPLSVDFSAAGSTDNAGIVSYSWDFGDGTSSNEANPTHIYTTSQNFIATLTVTDGGGLEDTDTVLITVESGTNSAPVANASSDQSSGSAPLQVNFSSEGSTDDKGIVAYSWNFGDGATSTEANPAHTYTQNGSYTATLTVEDEEGLQDTDTVSIFVAEGSNTAPTAVAGANPVSGEAPLDVSFSSAGSSDDKAIVSYEWDFGDGETSTLENPSHTYTVIGSYTATLTVRDQEGEEDTASVTIEVEEEQGGTTADDVIGVAPNPTENGIARLHVQKAENVEAKRIALFDAMGRLIYMFVPSDVIQDQVYAIPVGMVNNGVYYLKVYYDQGEADTVRFLVRN